MRRSDRYPACQPLMPNLELVQVPSNLVFNQSNLVANTQSSWKQYEEVHGIFSCYPTHTDCQQDEQVHCELPFQIPKHNFLFQLQQQPTLTHLLSPYNQNSIYVHEHPTYRYLFPPLQKLQLFPLTTPLLNQHHASSTNQSVHVPSHPNQQSIHSYDPLHLATIYLNILYLRLRYRPTSLHSSSHKTFYESYLYSSLEEDGKHNNTQPPSQFYINPTVSRPLASGDLFGPINESQRFRVVSILGCGTFGSVLKCWDLATLMHVAIKVIKRESNFYLQALMEIKILEHLKKQFDTEKYRFVKLLGYFSYIPGLQSKPHLNPGQSYPEKITNLIPPETSTPHLCLVFELLGASLYDCLRRQKFQGFSLSVVAKYTAQILAAMVAMNQIRIIHCDLKPENILLEYNSSNMDQQPCARSHSKLVECVFDQCHLKVIDFGSACYENDAGQSYVQSRFYRAPEVILDINYNSGVDVWSLGCIVYELYTGKPFLPGCDQKHMIALCVQKLGPPSRTWIRQAKSRLAYFQDEEILENEWRNKVSKKDLFGTVNHYGNYSANTERLRSSGTSVLQPDSMSQFQGIQDVLTLEESISPLPRSHYCHNESSVDAHGSYQSSNSRTFPPQVFGNITDHDHLSQKNIVLLLHFLQCTLEWDISRRWKPMALLEHPFVTHLAFSKALNPDIFQILVLETESRRERVQYALGEMHRILRTTSGNLHHSN